MKTKFTFIVVLISLKLNAQTLTYANFANALTTGITAVIGNQASFNVALTTTVGNGVTWNASGLTQQSGTPSLNLIYGNPSATPNASLFTNSNYVLYDPALLTIVSYDYLNISADSMVRVGQYQPSTAHEIYSNPDRTLIFPFSFNQSNTDTYAKTNYSNATTISSNQTGTRTTTYSGYGTLIMPQGTFNNVALISSVRTNSLGPDSYTYTWYDINSGKQLLLYSENNGSVTLAYTTDLNTGDQELSETKMLAFPNPTENTLFLNNVNNIQDFRIFNAQGQAVNCQVTNNSFDVSTLPKGLYFLESTDKKQSKKCIKFQKN